MGLKLSSPARRRDLVSRSRDIHALTAKYGATNPRLFGSLARDEDTDASDLDLLVDAGPNCTLLSLGGLAVELEALFGRSADVRTPADLHPKFRAAVLAQAVPL